MNVNLENATQVRGWPGRLLALPSRWCLLASYATDAGCSARDAVNHLVSQHPRQVSVVGDDAIEPRTYIDCWFDGRKVSCLTQTHSLNAELAE
jgi:hypothetical protein